MGNYSSQFDKNTDEDKSPHGNDGVDVTLIQWMLTLTPEERLHVLQQNIQSIMRLRSESRKP